MFPYDLLPYDSFVRIGKKYYPQILLKKYKYGVKNAIYKELNLDKFDDESDDESDNEYNKYNKSDEENNVD